MANWQGVAKGMAGSGWDCVMIGMAWQTEWHGIGVGMVVGRVCMVGVHAGVCDDVIASSNDIVVLRMAAWQCQWQV